MVAQQACDLTPREVDVLRLIAGGKSSKQAAYELGVAVSTVQTHRCRIFQKLGITKTAELVWRAAQMGAVDLRANETPQPAPALPQYILSMQQETMAERRKLASLLEESRILRQAARAGREEFRAVRAEVTASVEKVVQNSRKAAS